MTGIRTLTRGRATALATALAAAVVAAAAPAAHAGGCDPGNRGNICGNAAATGGSLYDQIHRIAGDLPQGLIDEVERVEAELHRLADDLPTATEVVGQALDDAAAVLRAVDDMTNAGKKFATDQIAEIASLTNELTGDYIDLVLEASHDVQDLAGGTFYGQGQFNWNVNSSAPVSGSGGLTISRACAAAGIATAPAGTMALTFTGAASAMYSGTATDPVRVTTLTCDVKQGLTTVASVSRTLPYSFSAVYQTATVPFGPFTICGRGTLQLQSGAIVGFNDC